MNFSNDIEVILHDYKVIAKIQFFLDVILDDYRCLCDEIIYSEKAHENHESAIGEIAAYKEIIDLYCEIFKEIVHKEEDE